MSRVRKDRTEDIRRLAIMLAMANNIDATVLFNYMYALHMKSRHERNMDNEVYWAYSAALNANPELDFMTMYARIVTAMRQQALVR